MAGDWTDEISPRVAEAIARKNELSRRFEEMRRDAAMAKVRAQLEEVVRHLRGISGRLSGEVGYNAEASELYLAADLVLLISRRLVATQPDEEDS